MIPESKMWTFPLRNLLVGGFCMQFFPFLWLVYISDRYVLLFIRTSSYFVLFVCSTVCLVILLFLPCNISCYFSISLSFLLSCPARPVHSPPLFSSLSLLFPPCYSSICLSFSYFFFTLLLLFFLL